MPERVALRMNRRMGPNRCSRSYGSFKLRSASFDVPMYSICRTREHSASFLFPVSPRKQKAAPVTSLPIYSREHERIRDEIVACERCTRLRTYCTGIGQTRRRAYQDQEY